MTKRKNTIGEVINLLKPEFPDITVSKIRFLESKGMIQPARAKSGYRQFTPEDISRIRYILQQQRDHFLPLKVIKSKLTAWERGEAPSEPAAGPPPESYFAAVATEMTRAELSRAAGLRNEDLGMLIEHSVIKPRRTPAGTESFGSDDLTVAQAAARLLQHGIEARHLRQLRIGSERTSELLHQVVAPLLRHGNPDARRRAAEIMADCASAAADLQQAIVRSNLASYLEE